MLKLFAFRRLMRCSWSNVVRNDLNNQSGILETRLQCCSQYIPKKSFSGRHPVSKKYILSFSVQHSISGLCNYEFVRCYAKKKKTSGVPADESDDEEDEGDTSEDDGDENQLDEGCKTVTKNVPSLRLDTVLKTGLSTPKRTVEKDFYAGKIRINGERVTKKSSLVNEGDEIDIVKEIFPENENFLVVNRVVVKSVGNITSAAQFPVKLNVFKALVIENYEDKWP